MVIISIIPASGEFSWQVLDTVRTNRANARSGRKVVSRLTMVADTVQQAAWRVKDVIALIVAVNWIRLTTPRLKFP